MKYLGVDFGLKRVGLATSEGNLSSPWKILEVKNFTDALNRISKIIDEERVEKVVVGMPQGKMGQNVLGFIAALEKKGIWIRGFDETLSSKAAKRLMIEQGVPKKSRRFEDAYSAAEILQNYLDQMSL